MAKRINDLPDQDRSREKMKYKGAGALSGSELAAILLRAGTKGRYRFLKNCGL